MRSLVTEPVEDLFKFSQLLDAELLELLVNLVVVGPGPVEGQSLVHLAGDRHPRLVTADSLVRDRWLGEHAASRPSWRLHAVDLETRWM